MTDSLSNEAFGRLRKRSTASASELANTTAQLMAAFEVYLRDECHLAARTVMFYAGDARQFAAWLRGQRPPRFMGQPDTVTHLLVRRYLSECARKSDARTVRRRLTSLRAFWRWLLQSEQTTRDPLVSIELPNVTRLPLPIPTTREVAACLESVPLDVEDPIALRDRALLEAFYATGATAGEMASLSLNDWDKRARTLRIGCGTPQERMVPIGREAERALQCYVGQGRGVLLSRARAQDSNQEVLWLSERGLPLSSVLMYQAVRRRGREAGIERLSPHVLRRACAIHLLRAGASPYHVVRLMGCQTPSALASYVSEAAVPESGEA